MSDYMPTDEEVREDFAYPWEGFKQNREGRLAAFDRWLAEHDAKVRAETLRKAREAINTVRNVPSLIALADKFGGYHQGQRSGLEMAEGIIARIEREAGLK